MEIGSNLVPYLDPETFERTVTEDDKTGEHSEHIVFRNKFQFSGKYGSNLMEEVARYAMVAGTIAAQQDFDIIHAHDWLTYSAGIVAKKFRESRWSSMYMPRNLTGAGKMSTAGV